MINSFSITQQNDFDSVYVYENDAEQMKIPLFLLISKENNIKYNFYIIIVIYFQYV